MRFVATILAGALVVAPALAQSARQPARTTKAAPAKKPAAASVKSGPADVKCPAPLGTGIVSKREFCDVLTGRDPAEGIVVAIPPHSGPATLTFDLHNRHTYSEQEVKQGRAFAEYTATIGVLTANNDLISRAVVQSSFRKASDLFDRVAGTGPGSVKAVAPLGLEPVTFAIPAGVSEVSILGERLVVDRLDGRSAFTSPGRPIAIVSNVRLEHRPVPAKAKAAAPARKGTAKKN